MPDTISPEKVIDEDSEPQEPQAPDEGGSTPFEPPPPPEPQETPAAPSQPPIGTEKELRALEKKLTTERERHSDRLSAILGDASTDALPCPLCFEGLMGFVLPGDAASLPDEQKAAALAFLGAEAPGEVPQTPGTETCSRCNGYGVTENPTKSPHHRTSMCGPCGGQGYVQQQQQQAAPPPIASVVQAVDAAQNGVVPPCPLCGAVNSAGRPHFCNPVGAGFTT